MWSDAFPCVGTNCFFEKTVPLMSLCDSPSLRITLALALLVIPVTGCSPLKKVTDRRALPNSDGSITYDQNRQAFWYDHSIRAYRYGPKSTEKAAPQREGIVRDRGGKKVRREEELIALTNEVQKPHLGADQTVGAATAIVAGIGALIAEIVILWPCSLAFGVVEGVLAIPFLPLAAHLDSTYTQEAEHAYVQGRHHYEAGSFDSALVSWEYALYVMPSLQAYSDVEFWRGRTFEALNRPDDAALAYATFLSYSESSTPSYFVTGYPNDPSWKWKADQAEAKIAEIHEAGRRGTPPRFSESVNP